MNDTQSTVYGQAYSTNIMQLAQQRYSKLNNTVYKKENVRGKTFFQDQIGQWSMDVKAGRNSATPNNDPGFARRMGIMVDYHDNRMLDRGDELKTISDPRSAYTIAAATSLGRKIDDVIIDAAIGTAYTGETGSTSVTCSNIKLVTAGSLTVADIVAVKTVFDNADVDMEDRFFVASPTTINSLLNVTAATSADFNSVKALVRGEINTFLGFTWIPSTRIAANANNLAGIAFQRYGVCLAMAEQPVVRTDERADLSYSWQVYYSLSLGAVRLEENRVVKVYTA